MNPWPKWSLNARPGVKAGTGRLNTTPVFGVNAMRASQFTSFVRTGKPDTAASTPRLRISPPLKVWVVYPVRGASAACRIRSVMFF